MSTFKTLVVLLFLSCTTLQGQVLNHSWSKLAQSEDISLFSSQQAVSIADNVLLLQKNIGGWPKNKQPHKLTYEDKVLLVEEKNENVGATIDNGATTLEMIFLSKVYLQHKNERFRTSFLQGLDYLIKAQYDNGGWPQYYPLRKGYYTHITYNDNAMYNVMSLLKDVYESKVYEHLNIPQKTELLAKKAFLKGIECILKTQFSQDGTLTVWCAQHDENTLEPAKARAYELPSLSGSESANIVQLLMGIEKPNEQIVKAVEAAVSWFKITKIEGLREKRTYNDTGKVVDKKMITDSTASPLWGRFMELHTNRPFFCDRDGIKKYTVEEIGEERRNGYKWYTDEPQQVLNEYPNWKKRVAFEQEKESKIDIYNLVVDIHGSGDFKTLQEAINAAKGFPDKQVIIKVKNGVYREKVEVYEWNTNMSIIGEDREKTIIRYDDYFDKLGLGRNSTFHTPTFLVQGNDFYMANFTIENTAGDVGQAVALAVNANRVKIENCTISGNQDTLYITGEGFKQYYKDCYIEGTTDFIFGQATALFENCEIHSKSNSFITAASTPKDTPFGYVFIKCKLTADENVTEVYLGRPWRIYAKTVFIDSQLGAHILPVGWNNWSNKEAEKQTFYAEYNNTGAGFQPMNRVTWSHQLTKKQARLYSAESILFDEMDEDWYLKLD